jgi:nucleosome binding factor SPN SPT16 subunit
MVTILHFHLHNPIMMGNKKTKDVQFYAEVGGVYRVVRVMRVDRRAWCVECACGWVCRWR